jgi:hypothetical protein
MSKFKTGMQIHESVKRESFGSIRMDDTFTGKREYISKEDLYMFLDSMQELWSHGDPQSPREIKARLERDWI